jgi:cell division septal protein FtsQ
LEEILVKGNNRIPAEKILTTAKVQIGVDKIYSFSDDKIERKILQEFAYVKQVDIEKKAPGTLIIEIVERQPVAMIPFHTDNKDVYGLIDIDSFILEIVEAYETYKNIIRLTDVLKEGEDENIFINSEDFPLLLDNSLALRLSKKLEKGAIQLTQDTLKCILKIDRLDREETLTTLNHQGVVDSSLYSEILSIKTKNANEITLKLKNGSVVFLSLNYLADGLNNFKTVFFYNKNRYYNYIDARFKGVVYCGEEIN